MTIRITPAQLRRLQIEWARLKRENDPRADGPRGQVYDETRDGRIAWARAHLGDPGICSFAELTLSQAGYLLDVLAGKRSKLDLRLDTLFRQAGIAHPAEWFEVTMSDYPCGKGKGMWLFAGFTLGELNRYQKWRLCELLSTRGRVRETVGVGVRG